jgi:hypothetical protein
MKEIYVHQDYTRVGFYKSILDEAGIPNLVRNEATHSSMSELPSPIFFPALCVLHDEDYGRAMQLLSQIHYAPAEVLPDWSCAKCNAEVPGNFDSCWQCGFVRDAPAASSSGS